MTADILTCGPTDPMSRAARIMWERDCGCVPVVDEERNVLGMVTDRDLCMASYTRGRALGAMTVSEAMSSDPVVCRASDEVGEALQTMARNGLRRLPVVDREQHLVGLLSLADALQAASAMSTSTRRKQAEKLLETLAAVSQPRAQPTPVAEARVPATAGA
jgi:CBS domain-containing protein